MSPQRINKIDIAGYKSIKRAELELRQTNVLIGPNGAGKSNLLSFVKLLRSLALGEFQSAVLRSGGGYSLLHFGAKKTPHIGVRLDLETSAGNVVYDLTLAYGSGDRLLVEREVLERSSAGSAEAERRQASGVMAGRESGFASEAHAMLAAGDDLGVFRLLMRCRVYHFHDTTDEAPIRQSCDIEDNQALHGDGRNLPAVLYKLQETRPETYQLIVRTVRLVAPFFHSFSLDPRALNRRTIALRWRERGYEEDLACHQLSDGTLRFIALATLFLQPKEDLPALVLVDEPELGLHPYAITVLASLIQRAANDCQVIVATQSPALLDQFNPEDIVVVERVNEATEFHRPNPAELAEWLEEYSLGELWDKNVLGGRPAR